MVRALLAQGDAWIADGQHDRASQMNARALKLADDLGYKMGVAAAVRSLGTIAALGEQPALAARRFGACEALLESIRGKLLVFQSIGYETGVASARTDIGEGLFRRYL